MSDSLALSDVLARSVSLQWHEAVAVVREVAGHMLANPGHARVVPELHQIHVTSTGEVDVVGGISAGEPVRRLGQLLQATLGQSDPPVQLRLVISQATAPSPPFDSIREFDDALGYFERPDRPGVLRALYERTAAVTGPEVKSTPTLDSIAPLSNPDRPESPQTPRAVSKRKLMRVAAIGLSLLILLGFALQSGGVNRVAPRAGDVTAMARSALAAVGGFVRTGLSAVSERVGLGRLVWSETGAAESAEGTTTAASSTPQAEGAPGASARPIPIPPSGGSNSQSAPAPSIAATQPILAFDLQPVPPALVSPDLSSASVAPREAPTSDPPAEEWEPDDALTVYSSESPDVVPPVGIRPQLPRDLPPDIRPEDLVSIEVVVLSDGTVDSVKLLGEVHNVHDLMWLSAVKAWQFRPAVKGGRPVRYRKTVWIAPQQ